MVSMGKGGKKTPQRVVELIKGEVSKIGQNATAKAIGLPLYSIQKYMAGITEPTQASLEKLANYFKVSVSWLRGSGLHRIEAHNFETVHQIRGMVEHEYSSIHAQNVYSILQLNEEENYKLADLIHDNFL